MLRIFIFCLMLIGGVKGNWEVGDNEQTYADLGFYMFNMSCNDAETVCQHCYNEKYYGLAILHIVEYTTDPPKLMFESLLGRDDYKFSFIQEDPSETFRLCIYLESTHFSGFGDALRATVCMDNDFTGLTVPAQCRNPIAVVSLDSHVSDQKIRGQQALYCAP